MNTLPKLSSRCGSSKNQAYKASFSKLSIYCVCVLFFLPCCKSFAITQMKITNTLHSTGLVVLDVSSPEFMSEVQKLLSPEAVTKAAPFLSQSIVIINNTPQFAWGFTVVYRYPDWISPAGTPWKHRISPSSGGPADRSRMFAPGARFLITPVSDFIASSDEKGNPTLQPYLDEGMDRMIAQFKMQHPSLNERVEIIIDSVIFEDGSMVGDDSERMMQKVNERIRAERDLATSLTPLQGENFRAKLLFHAHRGHENEYLGRVSSVAQSLLAVMDQNGESAAQQIVQQMRTRKWFVDSDNVRKK
jgi:hypothetical protein